MSQLPLITPKDEDYAKEKLVSYYADNLIPAEKKAYLTNLKGSQGPYMGIEGENGETHFLLDAASQIATLGLGFNSSVFMGTAHLLESWTNDKSSDTYKKIRSSFENFLQRKTGWSHITTTFCNSGAEANETALGYCYSRRKNKKANKVLAFEGSFHGRMLISLASTWNKTKREPFQFPGFETEFTPFPEIPDANIHLNYPQDWRSSWDKATRLDFKTNEQWSNDPILKSEVECLTQIREKLLKGDIFAIIIEPMQCEGGDRYGSGRFFTALQLMANSFGVDTIHDEVQTGFHLGKEFFWHKMLDMKDNQGHQIYPSFVTCAKKAQIGMVLSPCLVKNALESHEQFQVASMYRGYFHALALDQARGKIKSLEKKATKLLEKYCQQFSEFVERPRAEGLSFAFDLKDPAHVSEFIAIRFNHGLLYYPAGAKTLRFRLNTAFGSQDLEYLFDSLVAIGKEVFLKDCSNGAGSVKTFLRPIDNIYQWQELLLKAKFDTLIDQPLTQKKLLKEINQIFETQSKTKLVVVDKKTYKDLKDGIQNLQTEVYEPTRQTGPERFKAAAKSDNGVCLALMKGKKLMSIAFASPMAEHPLERGLRQDPHFNDPNSIYVLDTTVHPDLQGKGIGRQMKYALSLIATAKGIKRIKGRNRDQMAAGMLYINLSLGAYEMLYLREDYPDFEDHRDVIFYNNDLNWKKEHLNLSNAVDCPVTSDELTYGHIKEQFPYVTNKVCLSNFVSTRFLDHVKAILGKLPVNLQHGYTASGQSECVDKIAKSLYYNEKKSCKMLSFEGHYFGNGSFLSRSLSSSNDPYLPVNHLPCPTNENWEDVLAQVKTTLENEVHLAVWVEPLLQLSMHRTPIKFLKGLRALTKEMGVALIYNETSSQLHRYCPSHLFVSNNEELEPDAMMAFLGGQAGIVGIVDRYFIEKPLMMISTWDGDEFSFSQYHLALDNVLSNKEEAEQAINLYEKNLTKMIVAFGGNWLYHNRGNGAFEGHIPSSMRHLFKRQGNTWYSHPSLGAMKRFNSEFTNLMES